MSVYILEYLYQFYLSRRTQSKLFSNAKCPSPGSTTLMPCLNDLQGHKFLIWPDASEK